MFSQLHLSTDFDRFFRRVNTVDLEPLAYQLMYARRGPRWSLDRTVTAIAHYLAFLYLVYQYPHLQLVPSRDVDEVWHQHILDTSKYAADCQILVGRFVHHFPYFGTRSEGDRHNLSRASQLTQSLLQQHFGIGGESLDAYRPADCEPLMIDACRALHPETQQRPNAADSAQMVGMIQSILQTLQPG